MKDIRTAPGFRRAFISQSIFTRPIGGILVAEAYTRLLKERGHDLRIVMPQRLEVPTTAPDQARAMMGYILAMIRFRKQRANSHYYQLVPWISKRFTPDLFDGKTLAIATGLPTASFLSKEIFKRFSGYSFVQGHETWMGSENEIIASWMLPVKKAAISKWLQLLVQSTGEQCQLIPNGLDLEVFKPTNKIEVRNPFRIGMLWHQHPLKGMSFLLDSLEHLHQDHPQLEVVAFGAVRPDSKLPNYIQFEFQPTKDKLASIYNSCSIFIAPSLSEGFGLTPAEAMACGCAVVATDIGGHREFCRHENNAILVPPNNSELLTKGANSILNSQELRSRIARNGVKTMQSFDINHSADLMELFLGLGEQF